MAAEVIKCLLITTTTNTTGRKPSAAAVCRSGCGSTWFQPNSIVSAEKASAKAVVQVFPRQKKLRSSSFFCSSIVCSLLSAADPNYPAGPLIWLRV